jgi:predicted aspartyl protease
MKIKVTAQELLALAPDIRTNVVEAIRMKRLPVAPSVSLIVRKEPAVSVNQMELGPPMYACVSGKARAHVNGEIFVTALLDHGSEINIIPLRIFEKLDLPLDEDIKWKITTMEEGKGKDVLGVCHEVRIAIGGAEVTVPFFVVGESRNDLMLGRPWERRARAVFTNEDNGDVTVKIKSEDGRRIVKWTAAKANDERNRAFARAAEDYQSMKTMAGKG